jgi:hypothetical protein
MKRIGLYVFIGNQSRIGLYFGAFMKSDFDLRIEELTTGKKQPPVKKAVATFSRLRSNHNFRGRRAVSRYFDGQFSL